MAWKPDVVMSAELPEKAALQLHACELMVFLRSYVVTRLVRDDFKGQLGAFTPCFTDIIILGRQLHLERIRNIA